MTATRRDLFRRAGALAVVTAAAPLVALLPAQLPKLWGDGVHDDTAALQARIDRGDFHLNGGTYLLTAPIHLARNTWITNCWFNRGLVISS